MSRKWVIFALTTITMFQFSNVWPTSFLPNPKISNFKIGKFSDGIAMKIGGNQMRVDMNIGPNLEDGKYAKLRVFFNDAVDWRDGR